MGSVEISIGVRLLCSLLILKKQKKAKRQKKKAETSSAAARQQKTCKCDMTDVKETGLNCWILPSSTPYYLLIIHKTPWSGWTSCTRAPPPIHQHQASWQYPFGQQLSDRKITRDSKKTHVATKLHFHNTRHIARGGDWPHSLTEPIYPNQHAYRAAKQERKQRTTPIKTHVSNLQA